MLDRTPTIRSFVRPIIRPKLREGVVASDNNNNNSNNIKGLQSMSNRFAIERTKERERIIIFEFSSTHKYFVECLNSSDFPSTETICDCLWKRNRRKMTFFGSFDEVKLEKEKTNCTSTYYTNRHQHALVVNCKRM